MTERREIGTISAITDDDCGMYKIGEIDGGWNGLLEEHIELYGSDGILVHLAYMATYVIEIQRKVNGKKYSSESCKAG